MCKKRKLRYVDYYQSQKYEQINHNTPGIYNGSER